MDKDAFKFACEYVRSRQELTAGNIENIIEDAIEAYTSYGKPYKHTVEKDNG